MIFVTVGTNEAPFDRLLQAVDDDHDDEALVVQHGPSSVRPAAAVCFDFLPYGTLVDYVRAARIVISHAGTGSILVAVRAGKKPIVMPRLRRYREAVDDHQLEFAKKMEHVGLVDCVETAEQLAERLGSPDPAPPPSVPDGYLALDLRSYLLTTIGQPTLDENHHTAS